jgi:hypothetical protein
MATRQPPEQCDKSGCTNKATKAVCLSLAVHANHFPATSSPILYVCDQHISHYTFEDIIANGNWERICQLFATIGMQQPKKEFSKIVINDASEASTTCPTDNVN